MDRSAADGQGSPADYDAANRLLAERQNIGAGAKTVGYSYSPDSLLDTIIYPGGAAIAHAYTARRQLAWFKKRWSGVTVWAAGLCSARELEGRDTGLAVQLQAKRSKPSNWSQWA